MRFASALFVGLAALLLFTAPTRALATDVDGPDCGQSRIDFGDAPEGVLAYPGVVGAFPTCTGFVLPSTQEFACPPISTPPGGSGFVRHIANPAIYWLGCHGVPGAPGGIDTDPDGKTNQPAAGFSACGQFPTDCVEAAFGLTFDQDECTGDGSDAGVAPPSLVTCTSSVVAFETYNCFAAPRQAYLNILVDMNGDGDWNDNFQCPGAPTCAYEWAVKNVLIPIPPGCSPHVSPGFLVGPKPGHSWMRVTISDNPAADDFPWNGSAGSATTGGSMINGETEDYPVEIQVRTPTKDGSWGAVKALYRS